jgi:hypothetical protein
VTENRHVILLKVCGHNMTIKKTQYVERSFTSSWNGHQQKAEEEPIKYEPIYLPPRATCFLPGLNILIPL